MDAMDLAFLLFDNCIGRKRNVDGGVLADAACLSSGRCVVSRQDFDGHVRIKTIGFAAP